MADGSLEINNTSGGVFSFQDFQNWFDQYPEQRTVAWGKIGTLKERLENSDEIIKDPIAFFHDLYYDKKQSFRKILAHPLVDNLYSVKGLRNLFVESFCWIPRPNTERTPEYDVVEERRIENIVNDVTSEIGRTLNIKKSYTGLSIRKLVSLDSRIERVLYIFENLLGVSEAKLIDTFSTLGYGEKRATTYMNQVVQDTLCHSGNIGLNFSDIELNHGVVRRWMAISQRKMSPTK